jgi:hypothetical protein
MSFDASTKFDKSKNYTEVKFGEKKPVLETELNLLQEIQNEARADIVRQMVHSGVIDYVSEIRGDINGGQGVRGQVQVGQIVGVGYLYNKFAVKSFDSLINGFKLFVDKFGYNGTSELNYADLPEPPTHGTRDDLVFLEAWFEEVDHTEDGDILDARAGFETSRRKKLNWRIRTVAGVDFDKFPEGLGVRWDNATNTAFIAPQGGNDTPVEITTSPTTFFVKGNGKYITGQDISTALTRNDVGLYVSGNGTQASKDLLKTADGYVYAIPLFRVKRRNSGGYREDNVNGARDYKEIKTATNSEVIAQGETRQFTFTSSIGNSFKQGEVIRRSDNPSIQVEIVSIDSDTSMTLKNLYAASLQFYSSGLVPNSDRPDGKFANIIDKDDIIDLRHKVSLTGYNYQQLLEENFDKLLRGELQTKEKPETVKERFGLTPAPLGLQSQLMPVKVKGDDGVDRDLSNLLESKGKGDNTVGIGSTTAQITTDGEFVKVTSSGISLGYSWFNLSDLDHSVYYLAKAVVKNQSANFLRFRFNPGEGQPAIGQQDISSTEEKEVYLKLKPSDFRTDNRLFFDSHGDSSGDSVMFKSVSVYEIDQATYDKIDVDPEFTGEKLAEKFPYVSSYPNVVENIVPTDENSWENGRFVLLTGAKLTSSGSKRTKNKFPVTPSSTYSVSAKYPCYIFLYQADGTFIEYRSLVSNSTVAIPSNCSYANLEIGAGNVSGIENESILELKPHVSSRQPVFVPYGRWLLPYDYANGDTPTRLSDLPRNRKTWGDPQISEVVNDIIDPVSNSNLPHVTVTQATKGQWSVGDTIKLKTDEGRIGGIIDTDSAFAKIVSVSGSTAVLDDISKIAVGDTFKAFFSSSNNSSSEISVSSIDASTNTITINQDLSGWGGSYLVETTASSSSPGVYIVKNGVTGSTGNVTFSGLGTKEVIATVSAIATDMDISQPIRISYSINYPSGKGIVNLPSEVLAGEVNGLKYKKDNTLKLKADFRKKKSASVDENPHVMKRGAIGSLQNPSSSNLFERDTAGYAYVSKLDNSADSIGSVANGYIAQQLFSINIIAEIERQLGSGFFSDCLTLADKVAKAKTVVTKVVTNWYGYGSSPAGNKASLKLWDGDSWEHTPIHSSNSVSKLSISAPIGSNSVWFQTDGFAHFLAYAEPSDGTTASTINTDYFECEIEINAGESGYDVLVPEEPFNVLVDDPNMFKEGENMLKQEPSKMYAGAILNETDDYFIADGGSFGGYQFDFLAKKNETYTLSFIAKSSDNIGQYDIGSESQLGLFGSNKGLDLITDGSEQKKVITFTSDRDGLLNIKLLRKNSTGSVYYRKDSIMLTKGNSEREFVPYNKNVKRKRKLDFRGKKAGSTFENPHDAKYSYGTTFKEPSNPSFGAHGQLFFDNASKLDGVLSTGASSTAGNYSQHLYEFDLSHLGLSLKELKSALRKLSVKWTGYGKGDNGTALTHGATMKLWRNGAWVGFGSNTTTSPSTITSENTQSVSITNDQKVYFLVHSTHPAGANSSSEIYTDYISLEVELAEYVDSVKKNPVKVRKETKEVKVAYPRYDGRTGVEDEIELFYKHLPYQGNGEISKSKVVKVGEQALVTTVGTGSAISSDHVNLKGLSTRLPMPFADHLLVADHFNVSGVSTYISSLVHVKNSYHVPKYEYTRFSFKEGMDLEPSSSNVATHRGSSSRFTLSNDTVLYGTSQSSVGFAKFGDIKQPSKGLIALPFIVEYNGELFMGVVSYDSTADSEWVFYSHYGVHDIFKIQGRPLVKGVN